MIQADVLGDALAEAVISGNLQPLLRSSFGEGGFSLFLGINREINREYFCFSIGARANLHGVLGFWVWVLKLTGNLILINREFNRGTLHAGPPNRGGYPWLIASLWSAPDLWCHPK